MQGPVHEKEFNEAYLDRTGCPPSPPRRHTAMPSHICHAGSRGRARTGHSSLLATPVYTWKGKKMEHSWTINKPPAVQLCSVCIMSAWFFSFILFYLALVNWLIFWNVKMKAPSNLFSSTNLAGIMFQSGPELSLKSFGTSLAGLPFNLSLRSHINLWTNVAKSRRVETRPSFRERNQGRFGYLHLPGFSQNPFSMLHSELHSQPLRQKESDKSLQNTSRKKEIQIYLKRSELWNIDMVYFFEYAESHWRKYLWKSNLFVWRPPRTGEMIKLPLAMLVAIRIKTTAVRCIVIRKRHLSLLQNRAQKTPNSSLCEGEEQHAFVYLEDLRLLKSSIEAKKINITWVNKKISRMTRICYAVFI